MMLSDLAARVRLVNPITRRELRERMRAPWPFVLIVLYVALLGSMTMLYLYLAARSAIGAEFGPRIGALVFAFLTTLQVYLISFVTPAVAGSAILEERQKGTLDVLLASQMGPVGIVSGKLQAVLSFQLLLIAAASPLYGIMSLFGGISLRHLAISLAIVIVAGLVMGAASVAASGLFRRPAAAVVAAYLLCGLLAGLPAALANLPDAPSYTWYGRTHRALTPWFKALDPSKVINDVLGLEGAGLTGMATIVRATASTAVQQVQGGWRGQPMQITLTNGSTIILTQNTAPRLAQISEPKLAGRPVWQVHLGMMLALVALFTTVAVAAVSPFGLGLRRLARRVKARLPRAAA